MTALVNLEKELSCDPNKVVKLELGTPKLGFKQKVRTVIGGALFPLVTYEYTHKYT